MVVDTDYSRDFETAKDAQLAIIGLYQEQNELNDQIMINYTTLVQLKAQDEPLLADQDIPDPILYNYIFKAVQRPAAMRSVNYQSVFKTWQKDFLETSK